MDEDYILQKKIINVINHYMYDNILDNSPYYVSLEQFNEELKKFGNKYIISKINYILNKEKVKRSISKFYLCKLKKNNNNYFIIISGKKFNKNGIYQFDIIDYEKN